MSTGHNYNRDYLERDQQIRNYRQEKPFEAFYPLPPNNTYVNNPYILGVLDIRWDDPSIIPQNLEFNIDGVRIYRSFDAENGPYQLLTEVPIGTLCYRDLNTDKYIHEEEISYDWSTLNNIPNRPYAINVQCSTPTCQKNGTFPSSGYSMASSGFIASSGTTHRQDFVILTANKPIVKPMDEKNRATNVSEIANYPDDVVLKINDEVVRPLKVKGEYGEIFLNTFDFWDPTKKTIVHPTLPSEGDTVTVSYHYNSNPVSLSLYNRIFYKITCVGTDRNGVQRETPLERVDPIHWLEIEKPDWIWSTAIEKNRWILYQAGEVCKFYARKWNGVRCRCWNYEHKQAKNDCEICFGTSYVCGYEFSGEILIASPDQQKSVELSDLGLHMNFAYESWTSPSPLIMQRDFIVRRDGTRWSIGPVNHKSVRGQIVQQHFSIQYIDTKDIIYKVSVDPLDIYYKNLEDTQCLPVRDVKTEIEREYIPKYTVPREQQNKGRKSKTFNNITY